MILTNWLIIIIGKVPSRDHLINHFSLHQLQSSHSSYTVAHLFARYYNIDILTKYTI